ncbi:MAG: porin, partial [Nitrospirota bacterium]
DDLVKLQGEYIEGQDAGFRRRTWYHYILFRPLPFLPNFEPAYRYEEFTVDTNRPDSTLSRHTVGFNYYFHTNVKFTLNYEFRHDQNQNSTPLSGSGDNNANNKNFLTTQIQFRY